MQEFSPTQIDTAINYADDLLRRERGVALDGAHAAADLHEHVLTVEQDAEDLLTASPTSDPDYHVVLSSRNTADFARAATSLRGYNVLIPSTLVEKGNGSAFYRATIGEADENDALRLHVFCAPFRTAQPLSLAAETILSAAVEAEVGGLAAHGARRQGDEISAPHLLTLLSAAADPRIADAWQRGAHVDEAWRTQHRQPSYGGAPLPAASATAEMHTRLISDVVREATVVLSAEDFASQRAVLLWHASMRDQDGRPETAAKPDALVVAQAVGMQALREQYGARAIDTVKRLINP
jgi:hypothetical protein